MLFAFYHLCLQRASCQVYVCGVCVHTPCTSAWQRRCVVCCGRLSSFWLLSQGLSMIRVHAHMLRHTLPSHTPPVT